MAVESSAAVADGIHLGLDGRGGLDTGSICFANGVLRREQRLGARRDEQRDGAGGEGVRRGRRRHVEVSPLGQERHRAGALPLPPSAVSTEHKTVIPTILTIRFPFMQILQRIDRADLAALGRR